MKTITITTIDYVIILKFNEAKLANRRYHSLFSTKIMYKWKKAQYLKVLMASVNELFKRCYEHMLLDWVKKGIG